MFKPQPMHVTRAVQQAYGIDHPIGDPFGGAAYGELNGGGSVGKVLSSVIPMVAGAVMMLTPAAPMGAMLLGGAMFAGGALNGIGQLTGNQDLVKIGGITSAVAGVASMGYGLYTNWDSITGAVGGFLENGATTTTELGGATTGALETGGAALNTVNAPSVAADIVNTGSTLAPQAAFTGGAYDTTALTGELGNQINLASANPINLNAGNMLASTQGTVDAGSSAANMINNTSMGGGSGLSFGGNAGTGLSLGGNAGGGLTAPSGMSATNLLLGGTPEVASVGTGANLLTGGVPSGSLVGGAPIGSGAGSGSTGLLSSVGNFINKNPVVSLMGLQTVAGLAEGVSPKSQAEGEYLQAMAQLKEAETNYINSGKSKEAEDAFNRAKAYEQEKRNAYNLSITQMTAPNMAAATGAYNPSGIINQARA